MLHFGKAEASFSLIESQSESFALTAGTGSRRVTLLCSKVARATGAYALQGNNVVYYLQTSNGPVLLSDENLDESAASLGVTRLWLAEVVKLESRSAAFQQGFCDRANELVGALLKPIPPDKLVDASGDKILDYRIRFHVERWIADRIGQLSPGAIFREFANTLEGGRALAESDWRRGQSEEFLQRLAVASELRPFLLHAHA